MYDNYNYPAGADTPDAPWNQQEPTEKVFDLEVGYILTKTAQVSSVDYEGGYIDYDEDGAYEEPCDYTGDTQKDYEEEWYSPSEMLSDYSLMLKEQLVETILRYRKYRRISDKTGIDVLRRKIESAQGWEEEFGF